MTHDLPPGSGGVTIVGGRPMRRTMQVTDLPIGIEQVLTLAALNPGFREELLRDPVAAARRRAIELDPVEAALISSASPEQLQAMIDRMVIPSEMSRRGFSKAVAASVVAMIAGGAVLHAGCPTGIGPDYLYDDDSADDPDHTWVTLAGFTCYTYVPPLDKQSPGTPAPLLIALNSADEECLVNVHCWALPADAHGFHLIAVNLDHTSADPACRAGDLSRIADGYMRDHEIDASRLFLCGRGTSTKVVFQAAMEEDPRWAGTVLLGGVPGGDRAAAPALAASRPPQDPATALYHVIGAADSGLERARSLHRTLEDRGHRAHLEVLPGTADGAVIDFAAIWRWLAEEGR